MQKFIIPVLIITSILSCAEPSKKKRPPLTADQKAKIEMFSVKLIKSINGFDFSVINKSWHNEAFKERVSNHINKTQKSVLEHIFEKDLRMKIKSGNLGIIHRVNKGHGKVSKLRLDHFDEHSELILLMTFDGYFQLIKYRIEYINHKPNLTDSYDYSDNLWYSQGIVNMLRLNSKYDAFSNKRHQANRALNNYHQALNIGDSLGALDALYNIPESHQIGNWLSMTKIDLAANLGDTILANVMATEHEVNNSLYMNYLYNFYMGDSSKMQSSYSILASELGESKTLDSLISTGYLWNIGSVEEK